MILGYLSIKYILLDIFISSRNILGFNHMDIYVYIDRRECIFGNMGKQSFPEYIRYTMLVLILGDHSILRIKQANILVVDILWPKTSRLV
jgi:hypothetical protein